jgi:hypothetical protein
MDVCTHAGQVCRCIDELRKLNMSYVHPTYLKQARFTTPVAQMLDDRENELQKSTDTNSEQKHQGSAETDVCCLATRYWPKILSAKRAWS